MPRSLPVFRTAAPARVSPYLQAIHKALARLRLAFEEQKP
jgi:hypothetical protein